MIPVNNDQYRGGVGGSDRQFLQGIIFTNKKIKNKTWVLKIWSELRYYYLNVTGSLCTVYTYVHTRHIHYLPILTELLRVL